MKPGTLRKLDLLALARERELLAQMQRSRAGLAQMIQQRAVLEGYGERLGKSWRQGAVVAAAEAMRAVQFAGASAQAAAQMEAQAAAARQRLEAQQAQLVETVLRRRRLQGLTQQASRLAELERDNKALLHANPARTQRRGMR